MLKNKVKAYNLPQEYQAKGVYPYFRTISSEQDTIVEIDGEQVLMFGSNSYLGLTNHPLLIEASKKAIEKYGSGCAGSRFLNGTLDIHLELEAALADFVGKPEALVFSTGYQVNLGVLSSLAGRHDYIIMDEMVHACILDGARLSFGKTYKYKHNDMNSLEKVLQKCNPQSVKIIATDGVFSMEGDVADITGIVRLARKYNANIFLDDAHGIGVLGEKGRGTADAFGLVDSVDMIMGTFSKSLASIGGFVASDTDTINYLKHHARSLIFSASLAPANVASALAALNLLKAEPQRLKRLKSNTAFAVKLLTEAGLEIGPTQTPIIPIYIRDDFKTFQLTQTLLDEGLFVNPVIAPAVPSKDSLIRFSIMATHTEEQIAEAVRILSKVANRLNITTFEH